MQLRLRRQHDMCIYECVYNARVCVRVIRAGLGISSVSSISALQHMGGIHLLKWITYLEESCEKVSYVPTCISLDVSFKITFVHWGSPRKETQNDCIQTYYSLLSKRDYY